MVLKKKYRIVFDNLTKEIIVSGNFGSESTTYAGSGRSASEFDTELKLNSHILTKKLKHQPETATPI